MYTLILTIIFNGFGTGTSIEHIDGFYKDECEAAAIKWEKKFSKETLSNNDRGSYAFAICVPKVNK